MAAQDVACRHKIYGKVRVGGRKAQVQLGDRNTTKYINIESVYVGWQHELGLPTLEDLGAAHSAQQQNIPGIGQNGLVTNGIPQSTLHKQRKVQQDEHDVDDDPKLTFPIMLQHTQLPHDLQRGINYVTPFMSRAFKGTKNYMALNTTSNDHPMVNSHCLQSQQDQPGRELATLLALVVSFLLGRNVSKTDMIDFIRKCQQDKLLPLMAFVLGIGIYRYLWTRTIGMGLPGLSREGITLEDAYGHCRLVSMDVCIDFDLMRRFLQAHYQRSSCATGEALVKAGQFLFTIGSRRGLVIDKNNWPSNRIKPGWRMINSVYIRSESAECLECGETLSTSPTTGEFHCVNCDRFYRDFDNLARLLQASSTKPRSTRLPKTRLDSRIEPDDRLPRTGSSPFVRRRSPQHIRHHSRSSDRRHSRSSVRSSTLLPSKISVPSLLPQSQQRVRIAAPEAVQEVRYETAGLQNLDLKIVAPRHFPKSNERHVYAGIRTPSQSQTVLVYGTHYSVSAKSLRSFFSGFGTVTDIQLHSQRFYPSFALIKVEGASTLPSLHYDRLTGLILSDVMHEPVVGFSLSPDQEKCIMKNFEKVNPIFTSHRAFPSDRMEDISATNKLLYISNIPHRSMGRQVAVEELEDIFGLQHGFKNIYFRKFSSAPFFSEGLSYFVEFRTVEDALSSMFMLHGALLNDSIGTGIRMSFADPDCAHTNEGDIDHTWHWHVYNETKHAPYIGSENVDRTRTDQPRAYPFKLQCEDQSLNALATTLWQRRDAFTGVMTAPTETVEATSKCVIRWNGPAKSVHVLGSFANWSRSFRLEPGSGRDRFEVVLRLRPGTYHLHFIVDQEVVLSPELPVNTKDWPTNYIKVPFDTYHMLRTEVKTKRTGSRRIAWSTFRRDLADEYDPYESTFMAQLSSFRRGLRYRSGQAQSLGERHSNPSSVYYTWCENDNVDSLSHVDHNYSISEDVYVIDGDEEADWFKTNRDIARERELAARADRSVETTQKLFVGNVQDQEESDSGREVSQEMSLKRRRVG